MDIFDKTLILLSGVHIEPPGNLFFGDLPPREILYTLSGISNNFVSIQFIDGATISGGSMLLGSGTPSGIVQVVSLETKTVTDLIEYPYLNSKDILDVSN